MKITAVNGSPRMKGNSHAIVSAFCERAKELGAEINIFEMSRLKNVRGCQGCMACKGRTEVCVIKDDVTEIYEQLQASDIVVLASPVYFSDLSSQIKPFIDRLYQFFPANFHDAFDFETLTYNGKRVGRIKEGKTAVLITTQGGNMPEVQQDIHPRYEMFMRWLGFDTVYNIRGLGDPAMGIENNMEEAIQQAQKLANGLVK